MAMEEDDPDLLERGDDELREFLRTVGAAVPDDGVALRDAVKRVRQANLELFAKRARVEVPPGHANA